MSNCVDVMNLTSSFFPFHFFAILCCATLFLCRYLKSVSGLFWNASNFFYIFSSF